jgi:hypothetical protein
MISVEIDGMVKLQTRESRANFGRSAWFGNSRNTKRMSSWLTYYGILVTLLTCQDLAAQTLSYPPTTQPNISYTPYSSSPQVVVPEQSNAMSANSAWRGVNYPTGQVGATYDLPSHKQIVEDFGGPISEEPIGQVRHNEFGSYTIPLTSGVDIDAFEWQVMPAEIMYRSYLASQKESRLAAQLVNETDHDMLWDGFAGGRFGLLRYGNRDPIYPQGMQIDIEGAGLVRLDVYNDVDVQSVDFRAGVPISFVWGRHQTRIGYYHLSSHTGDEFLLKNPTHNRLNYARDTLFIGHGYYLTPELRIYGEMGWAFYSDVANEWEFQFGVDYSPRMPTGTRGAPFFAIHGHIREELDFGGSISAQVGWAWKGERGSGIFRTGLHYYNGMSPQYSFFEEHEQQLGIGIWYDY